MSKELTEDALLDQLAVAPAVEALREYFLTDQYEGQHFERFGGGGDAPAVADHFTSDDIVAVLFLSVQIPRGAVVEILVDRADELNGLLAQIPTDVPLTDSAAAPLIGDGSAAHQLWSALESIQDCGWVTAGKLMARKRPRLIPIYDSVVRDTLGRRAGDGWWEPLNAVLSMPGNPVVPRLEELRTESEIGDDISLLRVLDVAIWKQNVDKQ